MYTRLTDVLEGHEDNYLLPFYWQHGNHTERIPEQVKRIYDSGCRALCLESRPHPDFCGEGWWRDVDIIMEQAKKLGMKVWVLDDDRFPTGHANGGIEKKHPELRQWVLTERHIDVLGPKRQASVICDSGNDENILLGVYAYRRHPGDDEKCFYEGINITEHVSGNFLTWDIPEGVWRIFFYYKSRRGGKPGFIDMINPESVDVLIEEVYQKHYEHYKDEFGKTFAGFFSDEPPFGNQRFGQMRVDYGIYDSRIGTRSLALPWNENVENIMKQKLGFDPVPHLNLLWFEDDNDGDSQSELRFAYMDTVTELYRDCFSKRVGNWCREHNVMYIGHVIEDMNSHAHMGVSAGHYFRSLEGQDMSGMDIVLHQVIPGMADYTYTSSASTGVADGEFYHYILAKLCSSQAHLTGHMEGRAMCEVFGAYGWAEDLPMMKWLMDFLLVRGVNHFVPHAFSPDYPDPDCPPHFGAEGKDPSFEGFCALMRYTNKVSHLLTGTVHKANAALLYHAEGEWAGRYRNAMTMQKPAKVLYDSHIDFDIVSMDMLETAKVIDGKLHIAKESFDCLVVPYTDHMPKRLADIINKHMRDGLRVFFIDAKPENVDFDCEITECGNIAQKLTECGFYDVRAEGDYPHLRIYHSVGDGNHIFMFFNEDGASAADTYVKLPCAGEYAVLDLLGGTICSGSTSDGRIKINLVPYESRIVIFTEGTSRFVRYNENQKYLSVKLEPEYSLELAESENMNEFVRAGNFDSFFNITSKDFRPEFSGKMRYVFKFNADIPGGNEKVLLDLGEVGSVASVKINGEESGIRICPPYSFDITKQVKNGENTAEIVVSNTLAYKVRDAFSGFLAISPSGILGDVTLKFVSKSSDT